jgi:CHAD domain-containing protein
MSCHGLSGQDRQLEALQIALRGWFTVLPGATQTPDQTTAGGCQQTTQGVSELSGKTRLRHFNVLDERAKTVVRLSLELPLAPRLGDFDARHARLRLTGLRGYDLEHQRVAQLLPAAGFNVEGVSAKIEVPMGPDERSDVAVARVLRRLLEVQDANLRGTLADIDSEFLHDYRVAIRRTRSVQREMRGVFIPDELAQLRTEFKWLQDVTSATRDLDVYVEDFEKLRALAPASMHADLEPLRDLLVSRRDDARLEMERLLIGERAVALHAEWEELLQVLVLEPESERPDSSRPIAELAGERVRKVHRRMVKMGNGIGPDSPPQEYHDLRKRGKELRYLLELFAVPLFDAEVVRPMVRVLKGLQDVLGRHQDREVQMETLRHLAGELFTRPGAAATVMAIGVMVDRLEVDAQAARDQFAESFAEFASAQQRALVQSTFG